MWVQTRQPVSGPGAALPQRLSVPSATPPRAARAGAAGAFGGAAAAPATASAGEPSVAPPSGHRASAPGTEGTFLLVDDLPAPGTRDSFASIIDDPFFLRYHNPDSDHQAAPEPDPGAPSASTTGAGHHADERTHQPWIPPRKESLSDLNPTPWVSSPVSSAPACLGKGTPRGHGGTALPAFPGEGEKK
jgi:hypothetical protein